MNNPIESPLVSIIIRTKDRPKLLKTALESVFAQTYRPIEVVLVNDGGCDLDIYEVKSVLGDISLNYIKLEKNTGRAHAGNVGIENAKGDYIGFLDDDDEFLHDHISCLVSILQQAPFKIVYSDALTVYKEYNQENNQYKDIGKELSFCQDFDYDLLIFENYIPFMCLLFDREVFIDFDGFDTSFELYEDWDLLIRLGEIHSFRHIQKITAYYNQWSTELQISQRNVDVSLLKATYLKVLSKHLDKITVERIHDYMCKHIITRSLVKEFKEKVNIDIEQINEFKELIKSKDAHIFGIERFLREKQEALFKLESEIKEKNEYLLSLERITHERNELIQALRSTKGWILLERYRKIRNSILNTTNNTLSENLFFKGIKALREQGWRSFIRKANKKLLFSTAIKKSLTPIKYDSSKLKNMELDVIDKPIKTKISIIIPTKNAGDEFEYTLRKISQQEGVEDLEIIIIDSGSEDKTLDISRLYSIKVFQIPPENFHHSKTRNLGAEKASGGILVFIVQDALPIGNKWLYKLVSPIEEGKISAVSAQQIPRSDADFFASWSYWSHYIEFLNRDGDYVCNNSMVKNFDELDMRTKRVLTGLDSVCLAVKKEIFDIYKFTGDYAEDIELGCRLIKDGHSLMFQSSNAVIHSHNRPSLYYLKRGYIDRISLAAIFGLERKNFPAKVIWGVIHCLYCAIKATLQILDSLEITMKEPQIILDLLMKGINDRVERFDPAWQSLRGELHLDEFFSIFTPIDNDNLTKELTMIFLHYLESLKRYFKNYPSLEGMKEGLLLSIYKIFTNIAGDYLGAMTREDIQHFDYGRV